MTPREKKLVDAAVLEALKVICALPTKDLIGFAGEQLMKTLADEYVASYLDSTSAKPEKP